MASVKKFSAVWSTVFGVSLLTGCGGGSSTETESASGASGTTTDTTMDSRTDTDNSNSATDTDDPTAGPGGSDSNSDSDSSNPTDATTDDPTDATTSSEPFCGDGQVDPGEECDDGNANGPGGACLADCVNNVCGDNDKGPGEECDDGENNADNGVCKSDCTLNVCGDGIVGPGEACDDGDQDDTDECTNDCAFKSCGNGMLDEGEECDDGNDIPDDECTNTCVFPPSPCGTQAFEASLEVQPVDIIISIDNSGSMGAEIEGVQDNINVNFAQIIEDSGLDYRVIMVTRHGNLPSESVCIEAPLSGIPIGGCNNPPADPVFNPGKFYHYSVEISSHNMWCRLLSEFPTTANDENGEDGYSQWLRPEAFKTFIGISDDGIDCGPYDDNDNANDGMNDAMDFDQDLLQLSPEHFGTSEDRNYAYYSIVAMAFNNPPTEPYPFTDPIITGQCPTAADPGTGHQGLSILTESLRFPLCDTSSYDAVFQAIAQGVIEGSAVACEFPVPVPDDEQEIDLSSIDISYTPMGMGDPIPFMQVANVDQCGPNSFYILGDTIYLCPEACDLVQGDFEADIGIEYACLPDPG